MFVCFQYIFLHIQQLTLGLDPGILQLVQGPGVKNLPLINGKYITIKISANVELA